MPDFAILFVHLIVTLARLARPGGLRSVVAESVLLRHRLLILNRGRKRAPNLRATDRIIAGFCKLFVRPTRILRAAIGLRPCTLLHLHNVLKKQSLAAVEKCSRLRLRSISDFTLHYYESKEGPPVYTERAGITDNGNPGEDLAAG